METLFKRLLNGLSAVELVAMTLALAMMFCVMGIVTSDVFMRYVFNRPFSWAYDLISLYLMAGIFFLALSQAYAVGAHVSVDILHQAFSPRLKRVAEIVIAGTGLVVFVLIARIGFDRTLDALASHDVIAGAIPWPTWPAVALVPIGTGLLCLRLALHLVGHLASLLTGRDLIPVTAGEHAPGESFE